MRGWLLIVVGAGLGLPEIFTATPRVWIFWLGVLLALAGAVLLADARGGERDA